MRLLDGIKKNYVGLSSSEFKARLAVHKTTIKYSEKCKTYLRKYIYELKLQNFEHNVEWKILDWGTPFSPVTNMCNLFIKEKYHILFSKDLPILKSRSEIYSHCRHKQSVLLIPKPREKKIGPG